jgi:hypothetical protein
MKVEIRTYKSHQVELTPAQMKAATIEYLRGLVGKNKYYLRYDGDKPVVKRDNPWHRHD